MAQRPHPDLFPVNHVIGLQRDGEPNIQLRGKGVQRRQCAAGEHNAAARLLQFVKADGRIEAPKVQRDRFHQRGGRLAAFTQPAPRADTGAGLGSSNLGLDH